MHSNDELEHNHTVYVWVIWQRNHYSLSYILNLSCIWYDIPNGVFCVWPSVVYICSTTTSSSILRYISAVRCLSVSSFYCNNVIVLSLPRCLTCIRWISPDFSFMIIAQGLLRGHALKLCRGGAFSHSWKWVMELLRSHYLCKNSIQLVPYLNVWMMQCFFTGHLKPKLPVRIKPIDLWFRCCLPHTSRRETKSGTWKSWCWDVQTATSWSASTRTPTYCFSCIGMNHLLSHERRRNPKVIWTMRRAQ